MGDERFSREVSTPVRLEHGENNREVRHHNNNGKMTRGTGKEIQQKQEGNKKHRVDSCLDMRWEMKRGRKPEISNTHAFFSKIMHAKLSLLIYIPVFCMSHQAFTYSTKGFNKSAICRILENSICLCSCSGCGLMNVLYY